VIRYNTTAIIVSNIPNVIKLPTSPDGALPKNIGNGPISITPAYCTFPPPPLVLVICNPNNGEIAISRNPININIIPKIVSFILLTLIKEIYSLRS